MFDGLDCSVQALLVQPRDLLRWLDRVQPHIEKMADGSGGRYRASDIYAALSVGEMMLWAAIEGEHLLAIMLTEIVRYPRCRAMRCIGISGHRAHRWMHLMRDVEKAARERFGCDRMEALHTPRHAALLQTGGWQTFHALSEKLL